MPHRLPTRLRTVLAAALSGLLACAIAATTAAPAAAAPAGLAGGFVADSLFFEYPSVQQVPDYWYARMAGAGASWTRIGAYWGTIAPARPMPAASGADPAYPGYDWSYLDHAVRAAAAAHLRILLTIQWAPLWAQGRGASGAAIQHTWRPDPAAYGLFAQALARRYSGRFPDPARPGHRLPRISYFQAWNEPNLPDSLEPQWVRGRHGWQPASPGIYRALLNAAYAGIKRVQPHAYVLAAGLAPYGDPPGVKRMPPVQFLAELLCLHSPTLTRAPCRHPAHLDAISFHPYALTPSLHAFSPLNTSVPDLSRLTRVLRAAQRAHRVLPRGPKGRWVTEIDWDSDPPDPGAISTATQARYLSLAFYELWRQGVSHVFWYEIKDPGFSAQSMTGSGLFFADGTPKPSARAFHFPFVALTARRGWTLWGRAPHRGRVTVERLRGRRWVPVATVAAGSSGIFTATAHSGGRGAWRARQGRVISAPY